MQRNENEKKKFLLTVPPNDLAPTEVIVLVLAGSTDYNTHV